MHWIDATKQLGKIFFWLISIRLGHLGKYLKKLNNTKITGKKIMFKTNYKIKKLKRKENRRDQNIT